VDVRIIAATNRNLDEAVRNNQFREDLFYRVNVFPITIPPLRERVEDIPDLASAFVEELSRACGKKIESIAPESLRALQQYSWPGNVRELRNVIERAVIVARTSTLTPAVPRTSPCAVHSSAAHQVGSRRLQLARPRIERRRRAAGSETHHAREPDGEARDQPKLGTTLIEGGRTGGGRCLNVRNRWLQAAGWRRSRERVTPRSFKSTRESG
jgi:transcriptional regulator with GAF, ATPase, and Fis domain